MDHVSSYKPPKDNEKIDDETRMLHNEGCAPKIQLQPEQIKREKKQNETADGVRLPMRLPIREGEKKKKEKKNKDTKMKKEKKSKKSKKKKRRQSSSSSSNLS